MSIRGMFVDISGTLVERAGAKAKYAEGMPELFEFLREQGVTPILVSNDYDQAQMERVIEKNPPLAGSLGLTKERIGKAKGSGLWVDAACEELGVEPNELIYVGDSRWDMYTATQRNLVYFHAGWAAEHERYGVNVKNAHQLRLILKDIFFKKELWFWRLDSYDGRGRPVTARALIDGNGAQLSTLKSYLMDLKSGQDSVLGSITLRQFLILHMLASLYLEGLHQNIAVWCTYPGSSGAPNPLLAPLLDTAARLFHAKLNPMLINRHTAVPASHRLRMQRAAAPFSLQADSVMLVCDSKLRKSIQGHTVVVFDDFITKGNASEAARNLLMELGAVKVICVAIGKYGDDFDVQTPTKAGWDPTKPTKGLTYTTKRVSRPSDHNVLASFSADYREFRSDS